MAFRDRKHKASQWDYERILLIPRIGTYMRAMRTTRASRIYIIRIRKDQVILDYFAFLENDCQSLHALSRVTLSRGRARARELGPHAYRLMADDDIFDQAEAAAAATFSPLPPGAWSSDTSTIPNLSHTAPLPSAIKSDSIHLASPPLASSCASHLFRPSSALFIPSATPPRAASRPSSNSRASQTHAYHTQSNPCPRSHSWEAYSRAPVETT